MSKRAHHGWIGLMPQTRCPVCGSEDTVPIRYGMPGEGMLERAERGEVELGGCVVGDGDPDRACRGCGMHFEVATMSGGWPD